MSNSNDFQVETSYFLNSPSGKKEYFYRNLAMFLSNIKEKINIYLDKKINKYHKKSSPSYVEDYANWIQKITEQHNHIASVEQDDVNYYIKSVMLYGNIDKFKHKKPSARWNANRIAQNALANKAATKESMNRSIFRRQPLSRSK